MARQGGPIFLECTWDNLTFYKWEGAYFVRKKSSLTGKRVKTSPEFALTMVYANLMVVASKIASSIYSSLPINWRQHWMYRDFTGEALKIMDAGGSPQDAYDYLWMTYVEYWVLYQQKTGICLETGKKLQPFKRRSRIRKRHRTSNSKLQHPNKSNGRWFKSVWHRAEAEEAKRQKKVKRKQWVEAQEIKSTIRHEPAHTEKQKRQLIKEIDYLLQQALPEDFSFHWMTDEGLYYLHRIGAIRAAS